jgi:hypothetical protein
MLRRFLPAILLLLVTACVDSPDPWKPDGRASDVQSEEVTTGDSSGNLDTLVEELLPELVEEIALASPTCFEALECLMNKKEWKVGEEFPDGECTDNMTQAQTIETDALLGCMSLECQPEYDGWRAAGPGAGELSTLYGCLINSCAKPISVCVGGEGTGDCGDALWCLNDCSNPMDQECNLACLADTDDYQSGKTGDFLECIFAECPFTTDFNYECVYQAASTKCIAKCFEAAS